MRGVVVSIQVAILLAVILAIAFAVASYLYTTFNAATQYTYIAVTQAYAYPLGDGAGVKLCISVGGAGGLAISGVELNGVGATKVEVYVRGSLASQVRAGDVAEVKAFVPGARVAPGTMPIGRLYTREGFSFVFTATVVNGEPACIS
ncbi:MAG: hypothetical protein QXP31_02115 [Pyrobaculum sp.]